jgi:transcriptional regulator with XRE-family HTH domain
MNIFAERVRELRISNGYTQKLLGSFIGLSENSIASIEKGRNKTTLDNAVKLAAAFDVSLDYLTGRRDTPRGPYESGLEFFTRKNAERGGFVLGTPGEGKGFHVG